MYATLHAILRIKGTHICVPNACVKLIERFPQMRIGFALEVCEGKCYCACTRPEGFCIVL